MRKKNSKAKCVRGKLKKLEQKRNDEQYIVSNFLTQPGKTRSGRVYSKKTAGKASKESIFGSLITSTFSKDQTKRSNLLRTSKDQCSCKQCSDKRQKEENMMRIKGNHSGISIELHKDKENLSPSGLWQGKNFQWKVDYNVVQKLYNIGFSPEKFCDCHECTEGSNSVKSLWRSRQRKLLKQSMRAQSTERIKQTRQKHPLEQSLPKRKRGKVLKISQPSAKRKTMRKKQRKHVKHSKSLLKYVLDKKSKNNNSAIKPQVSSKLKRFETCSCCQRFLDVMAALFNKNDEPNTKNDKLKQKEKRRISRETLLKLWKPCEKLRCGAAPIPRAGCSRQANKKIRGKKRSKACKDKALSNKILFPSAGAGASENIFNLVSKCHRNETNTLIPAMVALKKDKTGKQKRKSSKTKKKASLHKKKQKDFKISWKLLTKKRIQALKAKAQKKSKHSKRKMSTTKSTILAVPMPSAAPQSKTASCMLLSKMKGASKDWPLTPDKKKMSDEVGKMGATNFPGAPVPSARVPTFIAMVKTAIRDLRPFHITGKDAIAKYIEIRYRVKNDRLLSYVLKWMVDMGVLKQKCMNYSFVAGKRLVKKQTVANLKVQKRRPLPQCMVPKCPRKKKPKRKSLKRTCPLQQKMRKLQEKRKSKKRRTTPKCPLLSKTKPKPKPKFTCPLQRSTKSKPKPKPKPKFTCPLQSQPKPKPKFTCPLQSQPKPKPTKPKKKVATDQKGCTCAKELQLCKNRIKLRTKYVRKNGKIYKQDEFV